MQILGMMNRWQLIKKGEYIYLPKVRQKKVVFQLNSEEETRLRFYPIVHEVEHDKEGEILSDIPMPDENSEGTFFAKFDGYEKIEFGMPIEVAVMADKDFWVRTRAGKTIMKRKASETFTQLADRQQINPNLEAVLAKSQENQIMMAQAMREQMQRSLELEKRLSAQETQSRQKQEPKQDGADDKSKGDKRDVKQAPKQKSSDGGDAPKKSSESPQKGSDSEDDA